MEYNKSILHTNGQDPPKGFLSNATASSPDIANWGFSATVALIVFLSAILTNGTILWVL